MDCVFAIASASNPNLVLYAISYKISEKRLSLTSSGNRLDHTSGKKMLLFRRKLIALKRLETNQIAANAYSD